MAATPPIVTSPTAPAAPWMGKIDLAWVLASAWLIIASALLWRVGPGAQVSWSSDPSDGRSAFVFDREAIASGLGTRASLLVPQPYEATVLHIAAADCRCTRRSQPHRQRIEGTFDRQRVRFVTMRPDDPFAASLLGAVPAAPAAVVLDRTGQVLYAGPYSNDGMCLPSSGQGAVERSLQALLAKQEQPVFNPLGVGCLCATVATPPSTT